MMRGLNSVAAAWVLKIIVRPGIFMLLRSNLPVFTIQLIIQLIVVLIILYLNKKPNNIAVPLNLYSYESGHNFDLSQ